MVKFNIRPYTCLRAFCITYTFAAQENVNRVEHIRTAANAYFHYRVSSLTLQGNVFKCLLFNITEDKDTPAKYSHLTCSQNDSVGLLYD